MNKHDRYFAAQTVELSRRTMYGDAPLRTGMPFGRGRSRAPRLLIGIGIGIMIGILIGSLWPL